MKKIILLTILIGIIVISNVNAFNVITHCYVSSQMFDIWQYYDPQFYSDLTNPADAVSYLVKKYYYIGLTMPDMLDATGQKWSINTLIAVNTFDFNLSKMSALDITPLEENILVLLGDERKLIRFSSSSDAPNHNLEGCYEAAEYARNHGWSSVDKALLYGQLMHVIQDQYAHMILQPSLFGYGTAIESKYLNPLLNPEENNLLSKFEFFYEIMVPSNIPDFSFVKQMFRGTASDNSQCTFGWGDFNSRYWSCSRTMSWSSMSQSDLPNLQKYVEAMNHCFSLYTNIHFEEIKLIMHGWGLITFFQSGYNAVGGHQGGIYANPNQSLAGYLNFTYDMGDLGEYFLNHLIPLNNILHLVELSYLSQNVGATIGSGGNTDMLEYAFNLLKFLETTPIRSVLEDTLTVDHIYNDIWPNGLKTPHSDSMYDQLRDNIATFEKYGNPYKFNRLEAYNGEIDRIISMKAFYKYQLGLGSINGPKYLNYSMELPDVNKPTANIFTLSRKAGILGGIIPIASAQHSYYDQPGIIDMHFELNGQFVYDSASVKIRREDAYEKINVDYKIINLGITKIGIERKWNGGYDRHLTNPIANIAKIEGQYNLNTNYMYNDNIKTVSYIIESRTKTQPYSYSKMIDSDYRDYYNNPSLNLNQNDEYVQAFHNGNPFRKVNENPYDSVGSLWPYILPIHYSNIINAPENIVFNQSGSLNSGVLTWHNNSSYGHRFKIWKEKYGSPKEYLGIYNDTSLTINSLQLYSMYNYHIQTINQDSGFYSDTSKKAIYVWPYKDINSSNIHPSSTWGTQILSNDGKLFMIYADGQDSIMFTYSTDNGINWSSSVKLDYRCYHQWVHNPSIYIENDTVYAVWIKDYYNSIVGDYLGSIRYTKFHYNSTSVTPFTLKAVSPGKGPYHHENYKNQPIIKMNNDSIYIFCQSTFDFNRNRYNYNEIKSYIFSKDESNPSSIAPVYNTIPKNESTGNNKIEAFFVNNELLKFYYTDNGLYCMHNNGNVDVLDEYNCLSNYLISRDPINQKINIISSNELSAKYIYYENGWHSENIYEYIERFDDGTMVSHNDYISVVYKYPIDDRTYYVDRNPSEQWIAGELSQFSNLSLISSTEKSEGSTLKPYYYNYITMINPYDERILIHKKYMGRGGEYQLDKAGDFSVNIKEGKIVKRKKENFGIKTEMGRVTVYYALSKTSPVNIDIHDISGRSIKRYRETNRHSGSYELRILLPRGVYFIKARTSEWNYKKKFIIL